MERRQAQRLRATGDLIERRKITLDEARELVGRCCLSGSELGVGRGLRRMAEPNALIFANRDEAVSSMARIGSALPHAISWLGE